MFTGLVETCGTLRRLVRQGPGARLTLGAPAALVAALQLGESVAVDGVCLTVVAVAGDQFEVEASGETLARTTLGDRRVGDRVHLERALRLSDRLGGHLVSGHVDDTGRVRQMQASGASLAVSFDAPAAVAKYLVPKGSIAVDGVSLTVNEVDERGFQVVLIPHTQNVVHLAEKQPGDRVNLEADLIGKYVERLLSWRSPIEGPRTGVDMDLLARNGFLK